MAESAARTANRLRKRAQYYGSALLLDRGERSAALRAVAFRGLRALTPTVEVDCPAGRFLLRTGDSIGKSIFCRRNFDESFFATTLELCRQLVPGWRDGATLVDVGANIGSTSIPALTRYGFGRAVAVEPSPRNLELLRLNVLLNGLEDSIEIVPRAACREAGMLDLEVSPTNSGDNRVRVGPQSPGLFREESWRTVTVTGQQLDTILADVSVEPSEVGLLWVDVQGFETEVLIGASRLLGAGPPVVIEYWPYGLRRTHSLELLWKLLPVSFRGFVDVRRYRTGKPEVCDTRCLPDLSLEGDAHTDLLLLR